ncbi:MAG: rhodanese-like domain-containing protein [Candidatus Omnitrophica bacterium]|nr:rhodanese-like domain-containing protein [Candidatus Omnitrophota bacterium]MCA9425135.1 rhodanese-like domain-containing protein [Candidatus Omnitrophota bacterium]MCA9428872.1 rhodanese-like domain-containing protein [Candidatus Omnitrophota bacterium]MCA9437872.1 rhodanese-like domain-containing protein [Candidatus Omnitrophota bacterium]MCA9440402.1 rhodanese-like domain-containing protein [Candidatus Omnitrophota bacterium]
MKKISTQEFLEMQKKNPTLKIVDVLPPESYRDEHIPGSFNVPLEKAEFEQEVSKTVATKEEPVVVYCASRECDASPKAAEKLEKAGFQQVYDYEGGLDSWRNATYET